MKLTMVAAAAIFIVVLVVVAPYAAAEASMSCKLVINSLMPCKNYMKRGGSIPGKCCNGVGSLNRATKSTGDRRTACKCMKLAAKAYKVNIKYAAVVPAKCRVNIGYPISYTTDCNKVR